MANPIPNENELYEQLHNEKITISPDIWDLLYNCIGDDISAINLLCQYYLNEGQPVPAQEAKKILSYCRHIKNIVNEITIITIALVSIALRLVAFKRGWHLPKLS